jgi:hypothetical protein
MSIETICEHDKIAGGKGKSRVLLDGLRWLTNQAVIFRLSENRRSHVTGAENRAVALSRANALSRTNLRQSKTRRT